MKYCDSTNEFENKENENIMITPVYAAALLKTTISTTVTIALKVCNTNAQKRCKLHGFILEMMTHIVDDLCQ